MSEGCASVGARFVPVTVIVKFFVFVCAGLPEDAVTEAAYVPALPNVGAMWMVPVTVPGAGEDVRAANAGSEADNVITSSSASVALTPTSAVAPSATVGFSIG